MLGLRTRSSASSILIILLAMAVSAVTCSLQAALIDLTPTNGVNSDDSVPLGELITGDPEGIIVGDKVFTGFNYSRIGDMPNASDVLVLGFQDPSGNWGISFHGVFLDLPGGGASDALIRYIVEVAPAQAEQGRRISDAHIFLGGVGVGPDSVFAVDETFLETDANMSVFRSTIGPGATQLSDFTLIDPARIRLSVTKDILALAGANSPLPARATVVDQSFSQVPEPAALLLAAIALMAGGFLRRRMS
jgi:hypothetical protein